MSDRSNNRREPRRSLRHLPNGNNGVHEELQPEESAGIAENARRGVEGHQDANARTVETKNQQAGPRQARGGKKPKSQTGQGNNPPGKKPTHSRNEARDSQPVSARTNSIPAPHLNSTPKAKLATPSKATGTTPRPYAGPGFHNSPDASTLKLPQYFSKSVPNVNKTTSLKSMMENTPEDSASEKEDLQSSYAYTPDRIRLSREESPLDMLFRADRAAKAKLSRTSSGLKTDDTRISTNSDAPRPSGPSLAAPSSRHHARHHTDGNAGSVFRMEMDSDSNGQALQSKEEEPAADATNEDPLLAKTRALKQLLNFPSYPDHSSPAQTSEVPSTNFTTPTQKPKNRTSARLSGTLPVFPNGMEGTTPDERRQALLALAEKQIASPNIPTNQRPLPRASVGSSKLPCLQLVTATLNLPPLLHPRTERRNTDLPQGGNLPQLTKHLLHLLPCLPCLPATLGSQPLP
ncbi:uncharacterized protein KY384_003541 [Bacidia gigantensis]|uniref:uncharacterized protein n=1 Tax=Bacidia gigantensis TaxID=2732470 RepID=UPI001D04E914|nr:uncharacterized protein KY384_003541 [Bacidia gigantensis]KAG8531905.1 hypothetical protein KY384_003541 [Bacidia gigantensis]